MSCISICRVLLQLFLDPCSVLLISHSDIFTFGSNSITMQVSREISRGKICASHLLSRNHLLLPCTKESLKIDGGYNICASHLLLPCTKESLKIDGEYKNNVITHKVALTDKIEKVVRTWKTKRACSTTNKYKSKQGMKAIREEAKELE